MMKCYQFFDLDGTVVESDYANFLAYQKAIKDVLGIKIDWNSKRFTREDLNQFGLSKKRYNLIISLKRKYFKEFLGYTNVNKSILELVDYVRLNDVIVVLVSNAERIRGEMLLKFHNIRDKFDYLFFKEDKYVKNKYLNALYLLGIDDNLVKKVIDDEEVELLNAMDAGIKIENLKRRKDEKVYN